ncbi:HNH endonuclease [Cellulomonas dongxiuzhuiae]|uniref:HNH endonuclease n=1 Tax=Cellulomonas dongxiuzhuiae TaxID=2819979 RepID=UPI0035581C52
MLSSVFRGRRRHPRTVRSQRIASARSPRRSASRSVKGKPKTIRQVEQDHLQARSRGGNNSPWNRREICARCNNGKGAK